MPSDNSRSLGSGELFIAPLDDFGNPFRAFERVGRVLDLYYSNVEDSDEDAAPLIDPDITLFSGDHGSLNED